MGYGVRIGVGGLGVLDREGLGGIYSTHSKYSKIGGNIRGVGRYHH